jgi:hypothetical protein
MKSVCDGIGNKSNDQPVIKNEIKMDNKTKVKEALEASEYALGRAICFKHPSSSQKEVEQKSLVLVEQALTALETLVDKDAVVSMLEGMKEVVFFDDGRVDSVTTNTIFTALDEAIKKIGEM